MNREKSYCHSYIDNFNFNKEDYSNENGMLKLYLSKVKRSEKFFFIEKNEGRMCCYYDEVLNDNSSYKTDIINIINKKNQLKALRQALRELPADKKSYIEEYFFYPSHKKPTLKNLSAKRNISRQAYKKNLKNSLKTLSEIVMKIYEEL